jgi:hypothetical protein
MPSNFFKSCSPGNTKLLRITNTNFDVTGQTEDDHIFYTRQALKKRWEYNGTAHQLFKDFKKAYDSVSRKVLYTILIEFGIPRKLVGLIKMCLNETYSTVRIGRNL